MDYKEIVDKAQRQERDLEANLEAEAEWRSTEAEAESCVENAKTAIPLIVFSLLLLTVLLLVLYFTHVI